MMPVANTVLVVVTITAAIAWAVRVWNSRLCRGFWMLAVLVEDGRYSLFTYCRFDKDAPTLFGGDYSRCQWRET